MRIAEAGDLLLSVRAPVGEVNQAETRMVIGRGLSAIRFPAADQAYAWHALRLGCPSLNRVAQGSTFVAVSRQDVETLHIPWSDEQEVRDRVAKILDTIDAAIERTGAVIGKLKQVRAGLLHDLLTRGLDDNGELRDPDKHPEQFQDTPMGRIPKAWGIPMLSQLCSHIGSGVTPRGGQDIYTKQGILFIRSQNVTFEGLLLDDVAFIPPYIHAGMRRSEIFPHDVLFNITGASIGRCCPMPDGLGTANVNQHVCALRFPNAKAADAKYLARFLGSHLGQRQMESLLTVGNRQGLNYKQLGSLRVFWPECSERCAVSALVWSVDQRIAAEEKALHKMIVLKSGLMADLLTGRVTVPETIATRPAP